MFLYSFGRAETQSVLRRKRSQNFGEFNSGERCLACVNVTSSQFPHAPFTKYLFVV